MNISTKVNFINPNSNCDYPGLKKDENYWFFILVDQTGAMRLCNTEYVSDEHIDEVKRHLSNDHKILLDGLLKLRECGPIRHELLIGNELLVTYGRNMISVQPKEIKYNRVVLDFFYDYALENLER